MRKKKEEKLRLRLIGESERQRMLEIEPSPEGEVAPIIDLVNYIVLRAIKTRGISDVHVKENEIYFRVDGHLWNTGFNKDDFGMKHRKKEQIFREIINRIKIVSELDISESRKPQESVIYALIEDDSQTQSGQAEEKSLSEKEMLKLARDSDMKFVRQEDGTFLPEKKEEKGPELEIQIRISIMPGIGGESIAMRILDPRNYLQSLDELGHSEPIIRFSDKLRNENSRRKLTVIAGPTGSGKTTTLYSLVNMLKDDSKNLITIEDPVECLLKGAHQIPVRESIGLGFAEIFKATLRHDPDIILLGELRDPKTAEVAFNAALAGRMVLTTIHADNSFLALERLMSLGVNPLQISYNPNGIISQRLLRRRCPNCEEKYMPSVEVIRKLTKEQQIRADLFRVKEDDECPLCNGTGYRERMVISEVLEMDNKLSEMVVRKASLKEIEECATREKRMMTMRNDAIMKLKYTTPEEILRCISFES